MSVGIKIPYLLFFRTIDFTNILATPFFPALLLTAITDHNFAVLLLYFEIILPDQTVEHHPTIIIHKNHISYKHFLEEESSKKKHIEVLPHSPACILGSSAKHANKPSFIYSNIYKVSRKSLIYHCLSYCFCLSHDHLVLISNPIGLSSKELLSIQRLKLISDELISDELIN